MSYNNINNNNSNNTNTATANENVNFNLNNDQARQDELASTEIPLSTPAASTHTTLGGNISYKGWILTYQDVVNNTPGDISTSMSDNLKWIPKFAVISKVDKIILLYDYEPSNEILINNLDSVRMAANLGKQGEKQYAETSSTSSSSKIDINYRLDNCVRKDMFVSYWRNRLHKFDLNLNDSKYDEANSNLNQFTIANHHLSNRDIETIDKDILPTTRFIVTNYDSSLNPSSSIHSGLSTTTSSNSTTTTGTSHTTTTASSNNSSSSNGTFRFAGLFFKRDKTDKIKHSSLKRAKSGIQLERKKPQTPSPNVNNSNNNNNSNSTGITNATNANQLDYDNRHRSHESLSSPLKQNLTVNYNMELDNELCPVPAKNVLSSFESRNQHPQTPFLAGSGAKASNAFVQQQSQKFIEHIIRLDLNGDSNAATSAAGSTTTTPTSTFASRPVTSVKESLKDAISLFSAASGRPVNTPYVNAIHNSLLNEENCFELRCPANSITIVNTLNKPSTTTSSSTDNEGVDSSDGQEQELTTDETAGSYRRASKARTSRRDTLPNLNQVKYYTSAAQYSVRYFMCRSSDERDKWIQCVRDVTRPNLVDERHEENSLQVWLLEAKGQTISSKPNKRYFCEIYINNCLYARTCAKEKKDILFWGENFEFNNVNCELARVEFYQQTIETHKKKSKKDLNTSNQTFLGFINIPVSSIESSQPIEKWYKLESPSASINQISNEQHQQTIMSLQQFESLSSSNASLTGTSNASTAGQQTVASLTTTQNFSKDSISIRIKAKYQCVDILPLNCYQRLVEFIRTKYLNLVVALEPHLNVRVKDDLANSLVKIAHKLQIQTKFLTDIVLAEVLQLEDNSLTFRGNSLATKAMESYMKLVGESYLKQTLSDCVRSIIDTNHDLEIDPSKVSNQSSLQSNREELVQILHLVCGRVFNSCVNFPIEMKHVFSCLRTECKLNGKTDEMCDTLISASIFLRFICPAILSPNLFNLTQEYPQEKAARKLTLAAKTLQTIANFSKFGGKEFYMSFDKMNRFVDEHTILMREFLRNISTLTDEENADLNRQISQPILSLTPQTPNRSGSSPTVLINNEINFDLELIDLGKQLSILHNLLNSILNSLDEATQTKFDSELIGILNEITQMRKNELKSSIMTQIHQHHQQQPQQLLHGTNNKNKLYSYENRLHHAVMKNQQLQSNTANNASEFVTTTVTTTPTTPSNATSISNPSTSDPNTHNNSSSSSSRYSSQITLNIHTNHTDNGALSSEATSQDKLEEEINLLRQKLKETEISLKKEQTEKYLIEYKLKQQQQENDQQMRSIINRLIKVEEELRKEQSEMHKLLKAKQDLIEIQKKRIEYLTNRSSNSNSNGAGKSANQGTTTAATTANHLAQSHPSHAYNQHPYQPKLKQNPNGKSQHKPVANSTMTSSHSNPNMLTNTGNEQQQQVSPSSTPPHLPLAKLADKSQIAASPSSSSSSMTQFCSYLAANSLMNSNQNLNSNNNNQQTQSKKQDTIKIASPSSSTSSSTSSTLSSIHNNRSGGHHNNHHHHNNNHPTSANQSASINFLRASEL